jgi:hypothetical protein
MEVQKQAGGSKDSTNGGSLFTFTHCSLQHARVDYEAVF